MNYDDERTFFKEYLGRLNQALALLTQETPPPDMPLQVAAILREVISAWSEVIGEEQPALALEFTETPDLDTLIAWVEEGICEATDGCVVEPDGHCPHGHPSWLLELGMI